MILDEIVKATKVRVSMIRQQEESLKEKAMQIAAGENAEFPFEEQLRRPRMNVICEVKKASPSKGLIAEQFDYVAIAKEYEKAGAAAISVLTEPDFFKGKIEYLEEISRNVGIPLLRKDFIIDACQIYEAKVKGAAAILLICAILSEAQLKEYLEICNRLHLSALVEVHDREEAACAVRSGARVIGVNNRNLKDFTVDLANSISIRSFVPKELLFIAESGIKSRADIRMLEDAGVNGVLIGETLMRAKNKKEMLVSLLTE